MQTASETSATAHDLFTILGTNHIEFYVGNARQAAYYYRKAFGFELVAYSGPETGNRETASYCLRQDKIYFILTTPLHANHPANEFLVKHGDGVKDIALTVENAAEAFSITTSRGAKAVREPFTIEDEFGTVTLSSVATYGDVIHTFVEKKNYTGLFLPGFKPTPKDNLAKPVGLKHVDHIVGNMDWNQMENMVNFYNDVFGFSRFVSFDDKDISTEYSALRSTV